MTSPCRISQEYSPCSLQSSARPPGTLHAFLSANTHHTPIWEVILNISPAGRHIALDFFKLILRSLREINNTNEMFLKHAYFEKRTNLLIGSNGCIPLGFLQDSFGTSLGLSYENACWCLAPICFLDNKLFVNHRTMLIIHKWFWILLYSIFLLNFDPDASATVLIKYNYIIKINVVIKIMETEYELCW